VREGRITLHNVAVAVAFRLSTAKGYFGERFAFAEM
jgi:hypothetical protein